MSNQTDPTIEIRRTVKESIDAVDSIPRADLLTNVAELTGAKGEQVLREYEELKRLGEVYEVPADDSPVVKRP